MHVVAQQCIPPQLAKDLADTLGRLWMARTVDDKDEMRVQEKRLNWLIDKVSRNPEGTT